MLERQVSYQTTIIVLYMSSIFTLWTFRILYLIMHFFVCLAIGKSDVKF